MEESKPQLKRYPRREEGQRVQEEAQEEALEEKHLRQITKRTV